jgi:hypothetical protein
MDPKYSQLLETLSKLTDEVKTLAKTSTPSETPNNLNEFRTYFSNTKSDVYDRDVVKNYQLLIITCMKEMWDICTYYHNANYYVTAEDAWGNYVIKADTSVHALYLIIKHKCKSPTYVPFKELLCEVHSDETCMEFITRMSDMEIKTFVSISKYECICI